MKINRIQNNSQSFKSITIDSRIRALDMKKVIKPCLDSIKEISEDYNIKLKSCSIIQKGRNFVSPRPAIGITIEPKVYSDEYISSASLKMPITDYKTDSDTLFCTIKSMIRNIF